MDHRLIINCVKTEFAVSHSLRTIIIKTQYGVTYNYLCKKILVCQENHGSVSTETIYTCCNDKSNTTTNMIRLKNTYKCYNKLILFSHHHDQRSFGFVSIRPFD